MFAQVDTARGATPVRLPETVVHSSQADQGFYGQPEWAARSRTSPITQGYVLSPFSVYSGVIWEGIAPQHGKGIHHFTPEIELGLPYRTQIAVETDIEGFSGDFQNKTTSVEIRYALADWNKIPLNPTLFAEWKFGTGHELQEEEGMDSEEAVREEADAEAQDHGDADKEEKDHASHDSHEHGGKRHTPNSYELRLLLSQNFGENVQWSLNGFFEQEVGGDREREIGFSQSLVYAPEHSRFSAGVEMQYIGKTKRDSRSDTENSFVIGPSFGCQITPRARLDVAPLFGIGDSSPKVDAFVVFSYLFGGGAEKESHQPISTMNR